MRRLAGLLALLPLSLAAQPAPAPRWIATWAPAIYSAAPRPTHPDSVDRVVTYVDRTLRQIVRTTIGGTRVRVRLTNEYGDRPLVVGALRIAVRDSGARIRPGTEKVVTFGGKPSVVLRAGAKLASDGLVLDVPPLADLAITLYLPDTTRAWSMHGAAYQTSYVSTAGNQTASEAFPVERTLTQWQFLAGVDVVNARATGAIVAIGNSITDGAGSTRDSNARWPDLLARRLAATGGAPRAVVNVGIGGNRVLSPTTGPSALARFDRDVLAVPGVTHVIVLEGINDILRGTNTPDPRDEIGADELIFGLRQLADRAHEHGLTVIGATLAPIGGLARGGPKAQAKVDSVNAWIRTGGGGAFDGVIDFYRATGDPAQPDRFKLEYDSGDHLHPSDAGYRAMADAIDLTLFRPRPVRR